MQNNEPLKRQGRDTQAKNTTTADNTEAKS